MSRPLSILYLLEETTISGTVRTVCAQADALGARGHRVRIATKGLPLSWRASLAEWSYVERYEEIGDTEGELVIAASWQAIEAAHRMAGPAAIHLCMCDESACTEDERARAQTEAAYALPVRRLVPSAHVAASVERFGAASVQFPPLVDQAFFRGGAPSPGERRRVLLCGSRENASHGVEFGYGAAAHARWFHQQFDLVRVSAWAPSREEPLDAVQEFHVALTAAEMTRLVHSCDVLVAPGLKEEGFSLPAAEALASGLACVVTSAPAFEAQSEAALVAPEGNAVELGERLIELLGDDGLHARLSARALTLARQWHPDEAASRLESILLGMR